MTAWLRLWHDMPTDPKFRVIAKRAGRPLPEVIAVFVLMLTNASANATERGTLSNWSDEDAAAALDMEVEHVSAVMTAMQGKILDDQHLTGWDKRQPKREDGSAERARQWRERNRTQPNAEKRPDTDTDTEREKERSLSETSSDNVANPPKVAKARRRIAYSPEFETFWQSYPDRSNNSKPNAHAQWLLLLPAERELALQGLTHLGAYCRKHQDYRCVHAERYLSGRRWESYEPPKNVVSLRPTRPWSPDDDPSIADYARECAQ